MQKYQPYIFSQVASPNPVKVEVTKQPEPDAFSWQTAAQAIQSGSWAVLLLVGIISYFFRGSFTRYISAQSDLLDKIKESIIQNAGNLKELGEGETAIAATAVEILGAAHQHTEILKGHTDTMKNHTDAEIKSTAITEETKQVAEETKDIAEDTKKSVDDLSEQMKLATKALTAIEENTQGLKDVLKTLAAAIGEKK